MDPTFRLLPLDEAEARALRDPGGDVHVADAAPGYPCRRCLRDADIGEELVLASHNPFRTDSPYRSASPVFVHRDRCRPPVDLHRLPRQLTIRHLSVRAFDRREMMLDAVVVDGARLGQQIPELFADEEVARLHVHNAARGCWLVAVERGGPRT